MSTKKNFTIEELKRACKEAKTNYDNLNEQLKAAEKEEADKKKAELDLQKEKRMEEITTVETHLNELYKSYIEDYGYLKIEHKADEYDWFPSFWRRNFWF